MLIQLIKPRIMMLFSLSEHVCAVGYALSEFAFAHSHLVLDIASGTLLAAILFLVWVSLAERYEHSKQGYLARELERF
jgi:hypothetical protein